MGTAPSSALAELIRGRLAQEIEAGRHPAGARLPPERELAERLHVSRGSVRQALSLLRDDGLVASAPQSGWFVSDVRLGEPPSVLLSFTQMAARRGGRVRTEVLDHRVREPTYDEGERLALAASAAVLDLERLRRVDGVPVCLDRSVIALARAPGLEAVDLADASLFDALDRLGALPTRTDFVVEATAADARHARHLGVPVGSPVLRTDELAHDGSGAALFIGSSVYRANAYRFHATLRRR